MCEATFLFHKIKAGWVQVRGPSVFPALPLVFCWKSVFLWQMCRIVAISAFFVFKWIKIIKRSWILCGFIVKGPVGSRSLLQQQLSGCCHSWLVGCLEVEQQPSGEKRVAAWSSRSFAESTVLWRLVRVRKVPHCGSVSHVKVPVWLITGPLLVRYFLTSPLVLKLVPSVFFHQSVFKPQTTDSAFYPNMVGWRRLSFLLGPGRFGGSAETRRGRVVAGEPAAERCSVSPLPAAPWSVREAGPLSGSQQRAPRSPTRRWVPWWQNMFRTGPDRGDRLSVRLAGHRRGGGFTLGRPPWKVTNSSGLEEPQSGWTEPPSCWYRTEPVL